MAPTPFSLRLAYATALPSSAIAPWWAAVASDALYEWMRSAVVLTGVAVGGVGGAGTATSTGTWSGTPRALAESAWYASGGGRNAATERLVTAAWRGTCAGIEGWPALEFSAGVAVGTSQWVAITAPAAALERALSLRAPATPGHALIRAWASAVAATVAAGRAAPPGGVVVASGGGGVPGSFTGPTSGRFL
jgi:hypothetical protein